jgi:hypothetical protein
MNESMAMAVNWRRTFDGHVFAAALVLPVVAALLVVSIDFVARTVSARVDAWNGAVLRAGGLRGDRGYGPERRSAPWLGRDGLYWR